MAVKVLIIEDDPEMNRLLQLDLEQHGYEPHVAVNGLDGLRMFHEIRPNLVVLDVALPQMDGLTVCQRIRELSNVPILIMTAHAVTEEEIAKGLNLYADDYLMVDVDARRVWVGGEETRLTPTEFKLLATFVRHRGQVLTFQQLLEQVWGFEYTTEHHYPRIYVSHLRRKIEPDAKTPTYIQNEYGIGYRFVSKD